MLRIRSCFIRFSHIVLLSAPTDIIKKRLASRRSNAYGKRPEELAQILDQLAQIEPLLRQSATHEIDATSTVDQIVTTLISLALSQVKPNNSFNPTLLRGAGTFL